MASVSAVNNINANTANTMGYCQTCGSMRQTSPVSFTRNVGMLVVRQTKTLKGNLCKSCVIKNFWDFTVKNLLFGPWGTISMIVTPIYFVTNIVSYISAMNRLKGAME